MSYNQTIMSFFNKLFGEGETTNYSSKVNWIALNSINQLDEITNLSKENTVLIFKHSTRCSVSRMVLKQFENEFVLQDEIVTYFLNLIEYRDISNEIATRFNVVHQSPQLIVIKDGLTIYNASHESIDANDLEDFI